MKHFYCVFVHSNTFYHTIHLNFHFSSLVEKNEWSSKICSGRLPNFYYDDIPFILNNKVYVYSGSPDSTHSRYQILAFGFFFLIFCLIAISFYLEEMEKPSGQTFPAELYVLDTTQENWEWTLKIPSLRVLYYYCSCFDLTNDYSQNLLQTL
jgi:hypothetical protein